MNADLAIDAPRQDSSSLGDRIGIGAAVTRRPLPHHRASGCTRRFESVALRTVDQARKTERVEVVSGSPTERALARARYHGPSPLPAVCAASCDGAEG